MLSKPLVLWSLVFIVIGAVMTSLSRAETDTPDKEPLGLVDAARVTLQGAQEHYKTGHATAEDVYRWSKRTADAEHAAGIDSAYTDHLKRMRALESYLTIASDQGAISGFELSSANYYVAEAISQSVQ